MLKLNYYMIDKSLTQIFQEFKLKAHLARHLATAHGLAIRAGSPRPVMKTRAAFCLVTTSLTRISRRLCSDLLRPHHAARSPFVPINSAAIKQECKFLTVSILFLHHNNMLLTFDRRKIDLQAIKHFEAKSDCSTGNL